MPYPVATGRIVIPYTVDGLEHKIQAWVRNPQLVGSDWMINSRSLDENDTHWEDAAETWAFVISYLMDAGSTPGTALLQTRVGGVFTTVSTDTVAFANVTGSRFVAQQTTVTLRDKLFNRFKVQLMEATKLPGRKLTTYSGGDAQEDAFLLEYSVGNATGVSPYKWQVSGWNQFMAADPLVAYVTTLNRKLRRARGVA